MRLLFRRKKGSMILLRLIPLFVLAIMATMIFFQIKVMVSSPYAATSLFVAKDTALLIDTIYSIPENIHYEYPTSLKGSVLRRRNETITIFNSMEDQTKISFKKYSFNPPKTYLLNSSPELDLNFFSLNKKNKRLTILDGLEAKLSLPAEIKKPLTKSNFYKKDQQIMIYSSKLSSEDQLLAFIKNSLVNNLEQEGINITKEEHLITLKILLKSSKENDSKIIYSSDNKLMTKPLAENIRTIMVKFPDLDSNIGLEEDNQFSKPSISIILGNKFIQNIKNDDSLKRLLAIYIGSAIDEFFKD